MAGTMTELKWDKKTVLSVGAAVLAVTVAIIILARMTIFAPATAGESSRFSTLKDSVTGEVFEDHPIPAGTTMPLKNPKTGTKTLYQTETCFWTKDGKATLKPTYVLVNEIVGKTGPTTCPDCGRPVVGHNPMPPQDLLIEAAKKAGK